MHTSYDLCKFTSKMHSILDRFECQFDPGAGETGAVYTGEQWLNMLVRFIRAEYGRSVFEKTRK